MKVEWTLMTNNYLKVTGVIYSVFRPWKTPKEKEEKLYHTPALPALLYGSGNWTNRARDSSITAAEIERMR
jgi:hypothetical protein